MAWYKNKETGMVWEVEGALAERLKRSNEYENTEKPSDKSDNEAGNQTEKDLNDEAITGEMLSDLTHEELNNYAADLEIPEDVYPKSANKPEKVKVILEHLESQKDEE